MSYSHSGIRHILLYHLLQTRQVVDTWIDEIDLSIARHLEINGISNNLCSKGMYLGLNGIAVRWWCLNDTQVACSHQRELQGTRNRRCCHRQRIDVGLQLAQLLLRRDAKLLLLINNQQTQVVELN